MRAKQREFDGLSEQENSDMLDFERNAKRNPDNIFKYKRDRAAMEAALQRRQDELFQVDARISVLQNFRMQAQQDLQKSLNDLNAGFAAKIAEASSSRERERLSLARENAVMMAGEVGEVMLNAMDAKEQERLLTHRAQIIYEIQQLNAQTVELERFINKQSKRYCRITLSAFALFVVVWGYFRELHFLAVQDRQAFLLSAQTKGVTAFARYILEKCKAQASSYFPSPVNISMLYHRAQEIIVDVNALPPDGQAFRTLMNELLVVASRLEAENFGSSLFYKVIAITRGTLELFVRGESSVSLQVLRNSVVSMLQTCVSVGNKLDVAGSSTEAVAQDTFSAAYTVSSTPLTGLFEMPQMGFSDMYVKAAERLLISLFTTGLGDISLFLLVYANIRWSWARCKHLDTNLPSEVVLWTLNNYVAVIGIRMIEMLSEGHLALRVTLLAAMAVITSLMMPEYGWIGAVGNFCQCSEAKSAFVFAWAQQAEQPWMGLLAKLFHWFAQALPMTVARAKHS